MNYKRWLNKIVYFRLMNYQNWLKKQSKRKDEVGMLSRQFYFDKNFRRNKTFREFVSYIYNELMLDYEFVLAFEKSWNEYWRA